MHATREIFCSLVCLILATLSYRIHTLFLHKKNCANYLQNMCLFLADPTEFGSSNHSTFPLPYVDPDVSTQCEMQTNRRMAKRLSESNLSLFQNFEL